MEFTFYGVTEDGYMKNADDMQSTPASSLNNDPLVNQLAEEAVDGLHKNATDSGLRVYHYGTTVNNPIGRAYYGLYNSISILVETPRHRRRLHQLRPPGLLPAERRPLHH